MSVPDQETAYFYTANGVTTTFAYGFYLLSLDDIQVSIDGVVQNSGFTVVGVGSQTGGAVIFASAPASGVTVLIERQVAIERDTDYQPNGDLRADVLNTDFDRLWMALQDKRRENFRSLRYPTFENLDGLLPNAASRANMVLGFAANGIHTMLPMPSSFGAGDLIYQEFTSGIDFTPGLTTALTLSRAPGVPGNLEVHFDTEFQGPDQWSVSGTTLTFNGPIPAVSKVFVRIGTTLSVSIAAPNSVGDDQLQWGYQLTRNAANLVEARSLPASRYPIVFAQGHGAAGDGGGGFYLYDPLDITTPDDNGSCVVGTIDGKRRKLVHVHELSVAQFGGFPTASAAANTAAFAAAYAAAPVDGRILVPAGNYNGTMPTGVKKVMWQADGAKNFGGSSWLTLPGRQQAVISGRELTVNAAAGATDESDVGVVRVASYIGGTNGFVNAASRVESIVSAGAKAFEWAGVFVMDNSSTAADGAENVALYAQAKKRSTGKTWAATFEIQDITGNDPAEGDCIGLEIACAANGADTNFQRNSIHVAMGKLLPGGTTCEWSRAFWATAGTDSRFVRVFENSGAFAQAAFYNSGDGSGTAGSATFRDVGKAQIGIDLSQADYGAGAGAMRLANMQKIYLEGTDQVYMRCNLAQSKIEFFFGASRVGYIDLGGADHAL